MPSHLLENPEQEVPPDVTRIDILANACADKQAGLAADEHEVSKNYAASVIYYYHFVRRIQQRLVCIANHLPRRTQEGVEKVEELPPERKTLAELFALSSHRPFFEGDRIRCERCADSLPKQGQRTREWLGGICVPCGSSHVRPTRLQSNTVTVGKLTSHSSHKSNIFKGLVYCKRCGARGPSKFVALARPCVEPGANGLRNLEAIRLGKLPDNLAHWPDQSDLRPTCIRVNATE